MLVDVPLVALLRCTVVVRGAGHTHQMVGQPSVDCPIVSVPVSHRETVPPHSAKHTLDLHGVGHNLDFLGFNSPVLDDPMDVEVSPPRVKMVLPQVIQLPLQRVAGWQISLPRAV